jgi:hypothetical protein
VAKIQTSVTVPVQSHDEARKKLMLHLGNMGAKLVSETQQQITLKRGSQAKMRILGFLAKDKDFPVLAHIVFDTNNPQQVLVNVLESMVVGTTLGVRDKYQRSCTEFAQLIAQALQ